MTDHELALRFDHLEQRFDELIGLLRAEMTVSEFAALGGRARAASMTKQERSEIGRTGGLARAASMTKQQRRQLGRHAAEARWKNGKKKR